MSKVIHHTIIKSAAKHDARFAEEADGGLFLVRISDERYRSLESWDSVGEAMEALKANEVTFEVPKGSAFNKCGVMAASYHTSYSANPHGPGCNDDLDCAMRDTFMHTVEGEKAPVLDTVALREFGVAIGLWNERWDALNPGMRRMNLANRIRGYLRNNAGAGITIGGQTGRFGVEVGAKAIKVAEAALRRKAPTVAQEVARQAKAELKQAA